MTANSSVYAVIGDPVAKSLSPKLHQAWFDQADLNASYVALPMKSETAAEDLVSLYRAGLQGLNVTLPYKGAALAASVDAAPLAQRLGAANTLVRSDRGWIAHNTDYSGLKRDLGDLGFETGGDAPALLIGAGGAARAAALLLRDLGFALTIANRTPANADALINDLSLEAVSSAPLDAVEALSETAALIVNAASFGHSTRPPFALAQPKADAPLAYDLSYGAAAEGFLGLAGDAGWRTSDGLGMLVHQGADAFALWTGLAPDRDQGLARLKAALGEAA